MQCCNPRNKIRTKNSEKTLWHIVVLCNANNAFVYFFSSCWSSVGKRYSPGYQQLSLGPGCRHHGTVVHELMHALGFWHEQSRPDRNKFIEIFWENIRQGKVVIVFVSSRSLGLLTIEQLQILLYSFWNQCKCLLQFNWLTCVRFQHETHP